MRLPAVGVDIDSQLGLLMHGIVGLHHLLTLGFLLIDEHLSTTNTLTYDQVVTVIF